MTFTKLPKAITAEELLSTPLPPIKWIIPTFTRHLRKLYKKCGLPEKYHLHTLRHFYAT